MGIRIIIGYCGGVKLVFTGGHITLEVAFKGPNVILELCRCNYSLTVKCRLSTAAGEKQGAGPEKSRWRARFGPRALRLPPLGYCEDYMSRPCKAWVSRKTFNICHTSIKAQKRELDFPMNGSDDI